MIDSAWCPIIPLIWARKKRNKTHDWWTCFFFVVIRTRCNWTLAWLFLPNSIVLRVNLIFASEFTGHDRAAFSDLSDWRLLLMDQQCFKTHGFIQENQISQWRACSGVGKFCVMVLSFLHGRIVTKRPTQGKILRWEGDQKIDEVWKSTDVIFVPRLSFYSSYFTASTHHSSNGGLSNVVIIPQKAVALSIASVQCAGSSVPF